VAKRRVIEGAADAAALLSGACDPLEAAGAGVLEEAPPQAASTAVMQRESATLISFFI